MTDRIAIVNSDGFIGSHLAKALPDAATFPSEFSLRVSGVCREICIDNDIVYFCDMVTAGSGAAGEGGRNLVAPNVIMMLNMFEAAAKAGVKRFICMSSTTGYPENAPVLITHGQTITHERPASVERQFFHFDPPECYRHIGNAKRFIERLADMYPEMQTTFLRCTGWYGPGSDFDQRTSHVIEATIRKVAERHDPITVWGDGEDKRDAVHIDDLVRAMVLAKDAPAGAYNIASGESLSINAILGILLMHAGYEPKVEYDLSKPKMIRERVLDTTKARDVLGWKPAITIPVGLCATYDWYRGKK